MLSLSLVGTTNRSDDCLQMTPIGAADSMSKSDFSPGSAQDSMVSKFMALTLLTSDRDTCVLTVRAKIAAAPGNQPARK
jgi:hypothetical protein